MKKSLIAIAVLGAAAFSAQAANVTLYGTVDGGFMYKNHKVTVAGEQIGKKENSFKFANGVDGANKIGIKGEEDLGNAKVGFKLENQFKLSDGEFKDSDKLFSREARLYVRNEFGELAGGRFGGLASAAGSYDLFFGEADAFDGGDNDIPYAFATSGRYDNSIAYQSPEIAGFQGTLMYSFQKKGDQADKMKDNDRYIGAGLTFKQDALALVGVFEGQIRANGDKNDHYKNGFTYNLGANYDFGMAKVFAGAQYAHNTNFSDIQHGLDADKIAANFGEKQLDGVLGMLNEHIADLNKDWNKDDADKDAIQDKAKKFVEHLNKVAGLPVKDGADKKVIELADFSDETAPLLKFDSDDKIANLAPAVKKVAAGYAGMMGKQQYNGYAFTLGSQIPFGANTVTVAGYMGQYKNAHDYIVDKKDIKLDIYGLDARYEYSLSKRTTLAAGAGIGQTQFKYNGDKLKSKIAQVYAGLHHNF